MREPANTADIRSKMMTLWSRLDRGEISHTEARVHIGFARTVLDTLKVEIAAAHLEGTASPVAVSGKTLRAIPSRKAA